MTAGRALRGDIDFFVATSDENARRIEKVLAAFGFEGLGLTAHDFRESGIVVQLGYPPNRIDMVTGIRGVAFEEAWATRVTAEVDGVPMVFIGKASLLANKAASGRPKDLADVDALS